MKRRLRSDAWTPALACTVMVLLMLAGCDSTGAGDSNGGGESDGSGETDSPGEALLLPTGDIADWNPGASDDVVVLLFDDDADIVHSYGPVAVADDGHFPGMTVEPPPSNALLSWEDFGEVYEHSLYEFDVTITDDTVLFQSFCFLDVQHADELICRGTDDGGAEVAVSWIYVTATTHITAEDDSHGFDATIDLELAPGWNLAVFHRNENEGFATLKTEAEPAGTEWFLE